MPRKNKKLALDSGIQTNQVLTNDDEVCAPRLSCILLKFMFSKKDTKVDEVSLLIWVPLIYSLLSKRQFNFQKFAAFVENMNFIHISF